MGSKVKPARNEVPKGYVFSPWNLSVADSADPKKNKWLVNATAHRAYDPVSGQVDFKKLAARIEKSIREFRETDSDDVTLLALDL